MTTPTDPTVLASLLSDRDETIASLRALLKNKEYEIADLTRDRSRLEGRLAAAQQDDECEGECHPEVECAECGHSNAHLYTLRTGY